MSTPGDDTPLHPSSADPSGEPPAGGASADATGEPSARPADEQVDEQANERLEAAVRTVETALIEFEIAVGSFRIEVENFARLHEERLGPLHQQLDELDARIAETVAERTGDPADAQRAAEARGRIMPMPQVAEMFEGWLESEGIRPDALAMLTGTSVQPPPRVRPSEEARTLFRDLIRRCHPDLAVDESERDRRGAFVARVNQAYARGDVAELTELTAEWDAGPAPQPTPLARAEELIGRLDWLAARKELLAKLAAELEAGAIGSMLRLADDGPDALLVEIAEDLRAKVATREEELARLLATPAAGSAADPPGPPAPSDGADGQ